MDEMFKRHRLDIDSHIAALKHLTLLENHPGEAIKTNVWGTKNLLTAPAYNMAIRVADQSQ